MKVCPSCESEVDTEAKFCDYCSHKFDSASVASEFIEAEKSAAVDWPTDLNLGGNVSPSPSSGEDLGSSDKLQLQFDRGRATFLEGQSGTFCFKLIPGSGQIVEHLRLVLQFPNGVNVSKQVPYKISGAEASLNVNFVPGQVHCGHNQSLECYVDAVISGVRQVSYSMASFDVLAQQETRNITIQGGINFSASGAADQRVEGVDILGNGACPQTKIAQLQSSWINLPLHESSLVHLPHVDDLQATQVEKNRAYFEKTLWSRPAVANSAMTLKLSNGHSLHLYAGSIRLGRSKECELVTRNSAYPESMTESDFRRRNIRMSSVHACMQLKSDGLHLINGKVSGGSIVRSSNGLAVNGRSVGDQLTLPKDSAFSCVLAPGNDPSTSFELSGDIHQGAVVLKRMDRVPEIYTLLEEVISLELLSDSDAARGWYLLRSQNSFAISNGNEGYFLTEAGLNVAGIENVSLTVKQIF